MKTPEKRVAMNTTMLMIFHVAKIVFPFATLPYLTRVLSTDTYGIVAYVKTTMTYLQVLVDFGFVLSATKDIVKVRDDKDKIGLVVGDTLIARGILGIRFYRYVNSFFYLTNPTRKYALHITIVFSSLHINISYGFPLPGHRAYASNYDTLYYHEANFHASDFYPH